MRICHKVDSAGGQAASQAIPSDPQHVSREDREAFVSRFEALDTDGSKVLEKDEYQKAAVSKFMSYDDARTLVTKDSYLTQSDFIVARARHEQAKGGVAIVPKGNKPKPPGNRSVDKPRLQSDDKGDASDLLSGQPGPLRQWGPMAAAASRASGVPAQIIAGQIWAESRGRMHTDTQNPDGKTRDVGVMQIGQERWGRDVVPKLTSDQRAAITAETGLKPEDLKMSNPLHNVVGGAFHLLNWKNGNYGQPETDWAGALNGYVNGNITTPRPIGPSNYSSLVQGYAQMINEGVVLKGEDYQYPKLFN